MLVHFRDVAFQPSPSVAFRQPLQQPNLSLSPSMRSIDGLRAVWRSSVRLLAGADRRLDGLRDPRPDRQPAARVRLPGRPLPHRPHRGLPDGDHLGDERLLRIAALSQSPEPRSARLAGCTVARRRRDGRGRGAGQPQVSRLGDAWPGCGRGLRPAAAARLHRLGDLEPVLLLGPCRARRAGRAPECSALRSGSAARRARGAAPAARSAFPVQRPERCCRGDPRSSLGGTGDAARPHGLPAPFARRHQPYRRVSGRRSWQSRGLLARAAGALRRAAQGRHAGRARGQTRGASRASCCSRSSRTPSSTVVAATAWSSPSTSASRARRCTSTSRTPAPCGQPCRPASPGIGLENVRRRLALHYPDRHSFSLGEPTPGAGKVRATLVLEGEPCGS